MSFNILKGGIGDDLYTLNIFHLRSVVVVVFRYFFIVTKVGECR